MERLFGHNLHAQSVILHPQSKAKVIDGKATHDTELKEESKVRSGFSLHSLRLVAVVSHQDSASADVCGVNFHKLLFTMGSLLSSQPH